MVATCECCTLICSADRCDLHDIQMTVDDEGGTRPSGRNPWRGQCLRIDALDNIERERRKFVDNVERTMSDYYASQPQFGDIPIDDIRGIVKEELRKEVSKFVKSNVDRQTKPRSKSGGTPL